MGGKMILKTKNCRLCGCAFVPNFKEQIYCKVCLDYKWSSYDAVKKENDKNCKDSM